MASEAPPTNAQAPPICFATRPKTISTQEEWKPPWRRANILNAQSPRLPARQYAPVPSLARRTARCATSARAAGCPRRAGRGWAGDRARKAQREPRVPKERLAPHVPRALSGHKVRKARSAHRVPLFRRVRLAPSVGRPYGIERRRCVLVRAGRRWRFLHRYNRRFHLPGPKPLALGSHRHPDRSARSPGTHRVRRAFNGLRALRARADTLEQANRELETRLVELEASAKVGVV